MSSNKESVMKSKNNALGVKPLDLTKRNIPYSYEILIMDDFHIMK